MRSALLTTQYSDRTYRRYTVPSRNENFLYIGKDEEKNSLFTEVLGKGTRAATVSTAIDHLKKFAEKIDMPGIVIISAFETTESSLKKLNDFITPQTIYSSIPFVLDVSGMAEADVKRINCFAFLDEIVSLQEQNIGKFVAQAAFLQKVKRQSYLSVTGRVETSAIPADSKIFIKRGVDIIVSLLAIIVLSPLFLLIALAIKLESAGPVFYISRRAGCGYKVFRFYKFRTMVPDADKQVDDLSHLNQYSACDRSGPVFFKVINDPRLTRVGAFLRTTSMDELPQFFNVLRGDMSLVGNRPLPLDEAVTLTTDNWAARFMAPAGMTGLWQIRKKQETGMSVERRIKLDIHYAYKCNFVYDLWIMANTPSALIQRPNT